MLGEGEGCGRWPPEEGGPRRGSEGRGRSGLNQRGRAFQGLGL